MRQKISTLALTLAALATLAGGASRADAGMVNVNGNGTLGDYSGTLDLTGSTLTLVINNLSSTSAGGKITGIAFNGAAVTSLVSKTDADFGFHTNVDANPYGTFDYSVALSSNFNGGGSPNPGIHRNNSATFVFNTSGATDVMDFLTDFSGNNADNQATFLVRFRGFDNGGSDKVPGIPEVPNTPPPAVPLPAAVWMGLTTLGGVAVRQYRRSRA
ncbi:MAG TPA: hypothetical protein VK324_02550 [Tepidisphaeraceae bacterium]|nr:hypothetical protein [Tepidisphaeraceae bacterium]